MEKLLSTIEAAKKQGYTNKTLSNALGKYDGYIARIISKPQSEKLQKFLIKEINELLVPAQIDDAMMISKEEYKALNDANANLLNDNSIKSFQISRLENDVADFKEKVRSAKAHSEEVAKYSLTLEKELSHKNQVLDKRNDKYNLLEGEFNELKFHFDNQTKEKEGLIRTINELEQQNKRVVDSNFELNDLVSVRDARISELEKDYWTRVGMHVAAENKLKKERYWFIGITVALLVLFVILHLV